MRYLLMLLAVLGALVPSAVFAKGPIQAPSLVDGQFVYTVPTNFNPPLINQRGVSEMNTAAEGLKYPFYVVIVKKLPGSGDPDHRVKQVVDGLAADWSESEPSFDVSTSQIFVLTYEPKKYALLAGAKFKTELGFERSAHKPYTRLFEQAVSGTPKDPKGGIVKMMQATDAFLWDQTDPVRIAERAEAARKAEEARRLRQAQGSLDSEINRLAGYLAESSHLPEDIQSYEALLAEARDVRDQGDPEVMLTFAGSMQGSVDVLAGIVDRHKSAERELKAEIDRLNGLLSNPEHLPDDFSGYQSLLSQASQVIEGSQTIQMSEFADSMRPQVNELESQVEASKAAATRAGALKGAGFMLVVIIIGAIMLTIRRRRNYFEQLQSDWEELKGQWEERIKNASVRYYDFFSERDGMSALEGVEGRTGELYRSVTSEVNAIYEAVGAMQSHLGRCEIMAAKASVRKLQPLIDALTALESAFDFDTGQLNKADLFGSETRVIRVNPNQFQADLQTRFEKAMEGWETLKEAVEVMYQTARERFPHDTMDRLIQTAEENGIPLRWLREHPLAGDDDADQILWTELDDLRQSDPAAFIERVDDLRRIEERVSLELSKLIVAKALAGSNRLDICPDIQGSVLDPDDDPAITFDAARREEDRLAGLFAGGESIEEIEAKSAEIDTLYRKAAAQAATAQSAIDGAERSIEQAHEAAKSADATASRASTRVAQAQREHAHVRATSDLADGRRYYGAGQQTLKEAERLLKDNRHLNARRSAETALQQFRQAEREFEEAIKSCDALDRQKANFERKLREMDAIRSRYTTSIRRHNGRAHLSYTAPNFHSGSVNDYAVLIRQLEDQERDWERSARQAKRAYEAEQERLRQERLRQEREERRRREEAERRRRAASYSSSSSSSGSSWGGGGSSSSGGSWGGGGSSASSGSW